MATKLKRQPFEEDFMPTRREFVRNVLTGANYLSPEMETPDTMKYGFGESEPRNP